MSLDRSLKSASSLVRHRNVLTRTERMQRMIDEDKWNNASTVMGMPKVANRKVDLGKGAAKAEEGAEGAAAAAAPAAGAKGAAPAAKAAAPAAGAKGAAPAAKAAAPAAGKKK